MNEVRVQLSGQAMEQFRQLSRQRQALLKGKVAALLEQELALVNSAAENLTTFQEAMQMSNEDMLLTFGADYLTARNWVPAHE